MIKSIKLKHFLINVVFRPMNIINKIIYKKKNKILFYCPLKSFTDNSKYLYDYLIENNYNTRYKIYIGINKPKQHNYPSVNVKVIGKVMTIFHYLTSSYVFYCYGKIPIKTTNKQCVINLWHGTPLKKIGKMLPQIDNEQFYFSYILAASDAFVDIMSRSFGCPAENVLICGQARNDILLSSENKYTFLCSNLILWLPTFRKSGILELYDSDCEDLIPLIKQEEYEELNKKLHELNIILFIKLHHAQDLEMYNITELSNLYVYSQDDFERYGYDLYILLSQANALISDYSSVYFDFLLLDRPIAFTIDDIESYDSKRGFVFNNPEKYMPGPKIKTKEELYKFISDVINNNDKYAEFRREVNDFANKYKDNNNRKRILKIARIE